MVDVSTDKFGETILFHTNPCEISVQFVGKSGFVKKGLTIFRRKYDVQVNLGERLRHITNILPMLTVTYKPGIVAPFQGTKCIASCFRGFRSASPPATLCATVGGDCDREAYRGFGGYTSPPATLCAAVGGKKTSSL